MATFTPRTDASAPTFAPKVGEYIEPESGNIVGLFFFPAGLDISPLTTDPATWQTAIDGGDIEIIPEVSGTWQKGEAVSVRGFGTRPERTLGYSFTQMIQHDGAESYLDFWAAKRKSNSLLVGYVMEDGKAFVLFKGVDQEGNLIPAPASFNAQPVSDGEGDSAILMFEVEIKHRRADIPYSMNVPLSLFITG